MARKPEYFTLILAGILLALGLRILFTSFMSEDMRAALLPWYDTLRAQGVSALGTDFSNYNPPYLYLLAIAAHLPIPGILAIKLFSFIGDFLLAYVVFLILKSKDPHAQAIPLIGFFGTLFLPTVILNSTFWGQCDVLYTLFIFASLWSIIQKRPGLSVAFYALSVAFKLQAIFLAPLFIVLFLRRLIPFKTALVFPAVFIATLIPAFILGRPILELLSIYPLQVTAYPYVSLNAPGVYDLFPTFSLRYPVVAGNIGMSIALLSIIVIGWILYRKRQWDTATLLGGALLFSLIIPFLLPRMHERYFYPADILALTFALYTRKNFVLPFLVGGASFLSYLPYLFGIPKDVIGPAAGFMAIAIIITLQEVVLPRRRGLVTNDSAVHNSERSEG